MTEKICAIVGFYQDRKAGERLLENLTEYNIPSIWADSRVRGFMAIDNSNISTDGFPEIIQSSPNTKLLTLGRRNPGEATMTLMQTAARMGYEYVIVLGCDEYLTGDWNIVKEALDNFHLKEPTRIRVPIVEHNPEGNRNAKMQGRIVFHPEYVKIKSLHWLYYSTYGKHEKIMGDIRFSPTVYGIEVHHDDSIREAWRNSVMDSYQNGQGRVEQIELDRLMKKGIIKTVRKGE